MADESKIPGRSSGLRKRAEEMLLKKPRKLNKIPLADMQSVVHELEVHQIELEMQNDELRRTQQELEASRQKYFDLYDLAPVGYVTLNEKGIILEANLTAAALLGKTRNDLVRQQLSRFIFRLDQDIYYQHRKRLFETRQGQECEVRMLKGDETQLWTQVKSVVAIGSNDRLTSKTTISDITRRKQAEEASDVNSERLKNRTSDLIDANEQLDAFNASISHDLRAPLRHMRGFFELLQKQMEGQLNEKSRNYALFISEAVITMESMIDALLSFSRIGRANIRIREVNLSKLVKETVREIVDESHYKTNKQDIIWKIDKLPNVYGEQTLLKLALVNLISNAVKFTSKSPSAKIEIGYKEEGDEFIFFVKDNGVGFNMAYADRLFGLFQRLHTKDDFEGTGIGLANVRRIISRHSGRVWAESSEGQGATFYFTLPREREREKHNTCRTNLHRSV